MDVLTLDSSVIVLNALREKLRNMKNEAGSELSKLSRRRGRICFEIAKTAAWFVVGFVVIMCLPSVVYVHSVLPVGFGKALISVTQSLR